MFFKYVDGEIHLVVQTATRHFQEKSSCQFNFNVPGNVDKLEKTKVYKMKL